MKIIHVAGARPNFMKVAPLIHELDRHPGFTNILVHTGQHYDDNMSEVFFRDLGLQSPDVNLGVGSGSHAMQTALIMQRFEPVLVEHEPDLVLVVGDVNSTLACSLVAAKLNVPIAHVEAGLRSFDRRMPEEINRVLTDALADLLFTPSRDADQNLRNEGIPENRIHFVGNLMVDSLLKTLELAKALRSWKKWGLSSGEYAVITLHRVSNVDEPSMLKDLISTLIDVARQIPCIFPVHPRTLARMQDWGLSNLEEQGSRLTLVEPMGYLDFLCLVSGAKVILTDSGGLQAESTMMGVPCLTLRENTEWPVTIQQGTNRLVGTERKQILQTLADVLSDPIRKFTQPEGWDGHAAERIVQVFLERFNP